MEAVAADIQKIARDSEGILEIAEMIQSIASQTNLLSMNAAIEAAHAGEAGKGFAVVADEIRKLAESSGEQAKTVSAVLSGIKQSVDTITISTEHVLLKFESIEEAVHNVSNQEALIRNAMEEQSAGSNEILQAISHLNSLTQDVRDGSRQMLSGSQEVLKESANLNTVTEEISGSMSEMSAGSDQIKVAVKTVNELTVQTKTAIDQLERQLAQFTVD